MYIKLLLYVLNTMWLHEVQWISLNSNQNELMTNTNTIIINFTIKCIYIKKKLRIVKCSSTWFNFDLATKLIRT